MYARASEQRNQETADEFRRMSCRVRLLPPLPIYRERAGVRAFNVKPIHAGFLTAGSSPDKGSETPESDSIRLSRTIRSTLKFRRSFRRWQCAINIISPENRR